MVPSRSGGRRAAALALAGWLAVVIAVGCTSEAPSPSAAPTTTSIAPAGSAVEPDPEATDLSPAVGVTTVAPKPNPGVGLIAAKSGVLLPVLGPAGNAFRVATPCGNEAITTGQAVESIDVVLDPGHGGEESGAVGPNGLREKDLNATVAGFARNALVAAGVRAIPTRNGDYRMTLAARGLLNSAAHPKAFVSIHHNAGSDQPSPGPGTDVYYQVADPESKRLGGLIWEEAVKALSTIKGVTWASGGFPGVKVRLNAAGQDYFGVVRNTAGTPGVLVEMGYLSNPSEAAAFADRRVQQLEGEAVARGIVRFLRTKDAGSGYVDVPDPKIGPMGGGGGGSDGCVDPAL